MKDVKEIHQWRNALNELCGHVRSVKGCHDEIFRQLELSYNRLEDENVQHCFLYCALYPEDYSIPNDELIDYWVSEGFLDDMDNVQTKCDRGYATLYRLIDNCLLESADKGRSVKMHNVIRGMALRMTSKSPLFMVKFGKNFGKFLCEQKWKENLERVCLMRSSILEIPSNISPKCQTLSTLLLQRNHRLQSIPECFFVHMLRLKILDLSYTSIRDLPNSVSNLINLKSLSLRYCERLHRVPSLAKLLELQYLDLLGTCIHEVPEGLEMLENLHYLNLFSDELTELPAGIFPKLRCLFKLTLYLGSKTSGQTMKEVAKLSNQLDVFHGHFSSLHDFNIYAKSLGIGGPRSYCLGHGLRKSIFTMKIKPFPFPEIYSRTWNLENDRFSTVDSFCKSHIKEEKLVKLVCLSECGIPREDFIEFPKSVQHLSMSKIDGLKSLNDVFPRDKGGINCIYSSLKAIDKCHCQGIVKLLSPQLLSVLQNLEIIRVSECYALEEIIAFSVDDDETDGNRKKELRKDTIPTVTLPKLKQLKLYYLPALQRICSNNGVMVCNSLQEIIINGYPKLERLSLSLPVGDNGEPSTLKTIEIQREIWDSLEWDQPNVKNVLNNFCKFVM